jgi:hypothetical protein
MAALYAVTRWEDLLSFQEWRVTGTYLFGFTSPTFLSAETEKERLCPCGKQLDEGGHHVQCCAKHTRGAWLVGHNAVQAVWKQAGEEAGFTARGRMASRVSFTPQGGSATFSSLQIIRIFGV